MNNYTIPKPSFPVSAWLFGAAVALGLAGLGIVAFETFSLFHGWLVALFFGLIIEFGAVVESIALAGGIRENNKWIIPGLAVTLLVSGGYNYLTAQRAGLLLDPPITSPVILAAVGIGPLSAVFFIAVQLGAKIREWEAAVKQWEAEKQTWLDTQAARPAQIEMQMHAADLEAQKQMQAAEIAARERAELRAARREARAARVRSSEAVVQSSEGTSQASEAAVHPRKLTYADFEVAMRSNGAHAVSAAEVVERFGCSKRSAYDWLKKYSSAL